MPTISRDDLSLSQGTKWHPSVGDKLSYYPGMKDDDETATEYHEALLALTRALRKAKGPKWTQKRLATEIGAELKDYKKWERRSLMPHRFITRFCTVVGVDTDDYLRLNVHIERKPIELKLVEPKPGELSRTPKRRPQRG